MPLWPRFRRFPADAGCWTITLAGEGSLPFFRIVESSLFPIGRCEDIRLSKTHNLLKVLHSFAAHPWSRGSVIPHMTEEKVEERVVPLGGSGGYDGASARSMALGPYLYTPSASCSQPSGGTLVRGGVPVQLREAEPALQCFLNVLEELQVGLAVRWVGLQNTLGMRAE